MTQFNIRNLPVLTDRQIATLTDKLGCTKTQLVIVAIDRLYQQEMVANAETAGAYIDRTVKAITGE